MPLFVESGNHSAEDHVQSVETCFVPALDLQIHEDF